MNAVRELTKPAPSSSQTTPRRKHFVDGISQFCDSSNLSNARGSHARARGSCPRYDRRTASNSECEFGECVGGGRGLNNSRTTPERIIQTVQVKTRSACQSYLTVSLPADCTFCPEITRTGHPYSATVSTAVFCSSTTWFHDILFIGSGGVGQVNGGITTSIGQEGCKVAVVKPNCCRV